MRAATALWRAAVLVFSHAFPILVVEATSRATTNRDVQVVSPAGHMSLEAQTLDTVRRSALLRREDGQFDYAGDLEIAADPFADASSPPANYTPDIDARVLNISTYCCYESIGQKDITGYEATEVRADFCGGKLALNASQQGNCMISNTSGTFLNTNVYQYINIADCEAICAVSEECYGFVADFSVVPRRCAFKKTVSNRAQVNERATDVYTRVWPNTFTYGQVDGWDEVTLIDAKSNCCHGEEIGTIPGTWANASFYHYVNLQDCQLRCNTAENCKGFVAYHGAYPPKCGFKGGTNYTKDHGDRDWYPRLTAK